PMSSGTRSPRPRGLFIAALLLLTLALAGAIALQAYRHFLGHKASAGRVLHDYARLAAARFANRTEMNFYYDAFSPALDALTRAKAGHPDTPLPIPSQLPATTQPHATDFRKFARYTFRYELRSRRLETAGATPSAPVRKWLRDTLPVHSRTIYDPKEHVGAIMRTVDGMSRAIVYTVVNDKAGAARAVVGLEEDPRALEPLYAAEKDQYPMLPRALIGGVAEDSFGSAIVTEADGVELYRSPVQYAPTFAARDSFEHAMMGAIRVQVALRPDLAPKLVIGGMPRSNLPMLLSLLAVTAGLRARRTPGHAAGPGGGAARPAGAGGGGGLRPARGGARRHVPHRAQRRPGRLGRRGGAPPDARQPARQRRQVRTGRPDDHRRPGRGRREGADPGGGSGARDSGGRARAHLGPVLAVGA